MKYFSLPAAVFAPANLQKQICSLPISVFDQPGWNRFVFWLLTSLISFIFAPPFPMREPHWLAGMTNRRVTGGLELMVPLATNAVRSWREIKKMWWESAGKNEERESQRERSDSRGQGGKGGNNSTERAFNLDPAHFIVQFELHNNLNTSYYSLCNFTECFEYCKSKNKTPIIQCL